MRYITEAEVRELLPMRDCIALMSTALERLALGEAINQPRRRLILPTGSALHYMAASDGRYYGIKVYSSHPKHGAHFRFLLYRAEDAELLAIIEANFLGQISHWRGERARDKAVGTCRCQDRCHYRQRLSSADAVGGAGYGHSVGEGAGLEPIRGKADGVRARMFGAVWSRRRGGSFRRASDTERRHTDYSDECEGASARRGLGSSRNPRECNRFERGQPP